MSNPDMPPLPDHQSCRALTGITVLNLPRDGSIGRMRTIAKGSDVWKPSDAADRIYFLDRGEMGIIACGADAREFTMGVIRRGDPFGELCFCSVTDSRRHSYARALVASSIIEVGLDDLYQFLQSNRQALIAMTYTFCIRLSAAEERLAALMHRDAEGRLGRVLISLATAGAVDPSAAQVTLSVSHAELARMAAMNRSHVTTTLGKFRKQGLIEYERGRPLAVNLQKLMVYLQLDLSKTVSSDK